MMRDGGYSGLSGREHSTVGVAVCALAVLVGLAMWHLARDVIRRVPHVPTALTVFDVPPPPPPPPPEPPPMRMRAPFKPIRVRAPAPHPAKRDLPRATPLRPPSLGAPPPIVPVAIAPIAPLPLPVAIDPGIGTRGLVGTGDADAAGGAGDGGGNGKGTGSGVAPAIRLTRAAWIRPPSRADFLREWPRDSHALAAAVDVVLLCAVRKNGQPFHCAVGRDTLPGKGFGEAAIRLAEGSVVRPVMRDGKRVDIRVIVPLTFEPEEKPAVPTGQPTR